MSLSKLKSIVITIKNFAHYTSKTEIVCCFFARKKSYKIPLRLLLFYIQSTLILLQWAAKNSFCYVQKRQMIKKRRSKTFLHRKRHTRRSQNTLLLRASLWCVRRGSNPNRRRRRPLNIENIFYNECLFKKLVNIPLAKSAPNGPRK